MRKVTSEAAQALQGGYNYKLGNTKVVAGPDSTVLELHGHPIAKITKDGLFVTSAGWETATTKERLNGIVGVQVIQKAGQWYLNGKIWEKSEEWTLAAGPAQLGFRGIQASFEKHYNN